MIPIAVIELQILDIYKIKILLILPAGISGHALVLLQQPQSLSTGAFV